MPSKSGAALHVATNRRTYKGKTYEYHFLRRSFRDGDKVRHETLGNISHLPSAIVDLVRRALQGEQFVSAGEAFEIIRTRPHGHVAAVLGTLRKLELDEMIATESSRWLDLTVAMIVARIIEPATKLATVRAFGEETKLSTLPEEFGLENVDEDALYEAMDWLLERQPRIEAKLAKRHLREGSLVLYDVTSSYYTGEHCPLAAFGHNRDGKSRFPQIVYGLLCSSEGCPVAVEVFSGNTGDPKTLGPQIEKIRKRFGLERVVLVGDRGLLTEARIKNELKPVQGLDWITALRAPAIKKLREEGALQLSLFDQQDLARLTSPEYPDERLIACFNPLLAARRAKKREELLLSTEKALNKIVAATVREKRPLQGKEKIGLRVGKVIERKKMGKHFTVNIEECRFTYARNQASINEEAALDGIYIIRTSVPESSLTDEETVGAYKSLSAVERAFRSLKTVDLKIRPIHHHLPDRVRAHVFLCMLAYYVEWHMRQALAPMLFDDDDKERSRDRRASIVAPAQRSESAELKAQTKRTDDGTTVHSFQTLLKDLATVARNRVRLPGSAVQFDQVTTPTPLQRRALDLLGVSLTL